MAVTDELRFFEVTVILKAKARLNAAESKFTQSDFELSSQGSHIWLLTPIA